MTKPFKSQNSNIGMPLSYHSSRVKQVTGDVPFMSGKGSYQLVSGSCDLLIQNISGSIFSSASKKGGDVENTPLCTNNKELN